jgi:putative restriction endonuclease
MYTPPDELEIGDRLSQEEIEDIFDTGFGYRISGINPRRDDTDNRYILLFANEDGPYDDSVKWGRFEYDGEGEDRNQSESDPGNSSLIDAVSDDFPVLFFYKESGSDRWEYQGQVDVLSYRREERDEYEVLVFSLEHQAASDDSIPGLYLIPVSDIWIDKFGSSVEEPHDLRQYSEVPPQLEGIDRIRIWGATETDADKKQSAIDEMEPRDCILFYHNGEFFSGGVVGRTFENPDVGELLWNSSESRHLFTVEEFTYDVPDIERMWKMVGYEGRQVVQGFTRVADERVEEIRREHGSLESVLFGEEDREPTEEEIVREKSELESAVETEPELTEDDTQYIETRRRARDRAFTELVREAYDNTCAVCRRQRESPDGNPEVEAAHIYPKGKGGSDDVRNGIALCRLHHWAFDCGWLSFTDDLEVVVSESPEKKGYDEFRKLDGVGLNIPENPDLKPHPLFIAEHRRIHNLN